MGPSRVILRDSASQIAEVLRHTEARLGESITGAAVALLDSAPPDLWPRAQRLCSSAVEAADEAATAGLAGYELSEEVGRLSCSTCQNLLHLGTWKFCFRWAPARLVSLSEPEPAMC